MPDRPRLEPGSIPLEPGWYEELTIDEFQRFCDRIAERAAARGLTEDKLAEILTG